MNETTNPSLDEAIEVVRKLPELAQTAIASAIMKYAERHRALNQELSEAEGRLDAGECIEAEAVIAELRRRRNSRNA